MYGLILNAAVAYLQNVYPSVYQTVLEELGFAEQRDLDQYQIYSDKLFSRITKLMSDKTGTTENQLAEQIGEYFIDYVSRVGYHDLLFSLGRTISDLFNELDNLHEYIRFTYPKLKAPSFICLNESADGITLLYRSRRKGFHYYVKGVFRGVALRYFNTTITVEIISSKEFGDRNEFIYSLLFDNSGLYAAAGDVILRDTYFKNKVIMADTIFELYPFHVLINESMEIWSIGKGLKQLFPKALREDFSALFEITRPDIETTFKSIQNHLNNIFEVNCLLAQKDASSKLPTEKKEGSRHGTQDQEENELILKGQMIYVEEWNCIMYVGFPLLITPEQMLKIGLYLSDLCLFDASRDLVMAAAQDMADRALTSKLLSVKGDVVAEATQMTDRAKEDWRNTHYSLVPKSISQRLMRSEPAYAMASVFDKAVLACIEVIDDNKSGSSDDSRTFFTQVEELHKDAQQLCAKYNAFKVDGRLTDFMILVGVPDNVASPELVAFRVANFLVEKYDICVGMASGQVAAGVVGSKLLAYKPFGAAVKLSRKLARESKKGCILANEALAEYCLKKPERGIEATPADEIKDGDETLKSFWLKANKHFKASGSSSKPT